MAAVRGRTSRVKLLSVALAKSVLTPRHVGKKSVGRLRCRRNTHATSQELLAWSRWTTYPILAQPAR